jgi:hypothetical protein
MTSFDSTVYTCLHPSKAKSRLIDETAGLQGGGTPFRCYSVINHFACSFSSFFTLDSAHVVQVVVMAACYSYMLTLRVFSFCSGNQSMTINTLSFFISRFIYPFSMSLTCYTAYKKRSIVT